MTEKYFGVPAIVEWVDADIDFKNDGTSIEESLKETGTVTHSIGYLYENEQAYVLVSSKSEEIATVRMTIPKTHVKKITVLTEAINE